MKCLVVAMMLAGSMIAQTKPTAEVTATTRPPTIKIGIDLQLGMSRDAIVAQLATRYKVVKIQGDDDEWIVKEKENPMPTIAHLEFRAGKLTYASKIWSQGQRDDYAFAQAWWAAMADMDREDQHACSFEVPASHSATADMSYMRLHCGPKMIDITAINVLNGTGRHYTSISEVLSLEESRKGEPSASQ